MEGKILKDKAMQIIRERQLWSLMNDTKWRELQVAMRTEMPFAPPYILKIISEEICLEEPYFQKDVSYLGNWDDEILCWGEFYWIEWVKIRPRYLKFRGKLIAPALLDATEQFLEILHRLNIPYDVEDDMYCIYGYKEPMKLIK